jgi:hypothetical protein
LLTEVEKLNVPGLQATETFPLKATVGMLEIDGREMLDGGGF